MLLIHWLSGAPQPRRPRRLAPRCRIVGMRPRGPRARRRAQRQAAREGQPQARRACGGTALLTWRRSTRASSLRLVRSCRRRACTPRCLTSTPSTWRAGQPKRRACPPPCPMVRRDEQRCRRRAGMLRTTCSHDLSPADQVMGRCLARRRCEWCARRWPILWRARRSASAAGDTGAVCAGRVGLQGPSGPGEARGRPGGCRRSAAPRHSR
jgi:hypothetical protein